ncbi:MAG: hypothetical protein R3A11_08465 [Bdellovibrionota bacterium]
MPACFAQQVIPKEHNQNLLFQDSRGRPWNIRVQSPTDIVATNLLRWENTITKHFEDLMYFNSILGTESSQYEQDIVKDVALQFQMQSKVHNIDSEELVAIFVAFVDQYPSIFPYLTVNKNIMTPAVLLRTGIRDRRDKILILTSLLSAFCFDVQMVLMDGQWNMSIRSKSNSGQYSHRYNKAAYAVQGMNQGMEIKIDKFSDIDETCLVESSFRKPISSIEDFHLDMNSAWENRSITRVNRERINDQIHYQYNNIDTYVRSLRFRKNTKGWIFGGNQEQFYEPVGTIYEES